MSLHIDSVIRGKSVACSLCVCDFDFSLSHSNALSLFGEKYNGEEPLLSKTTISFSLSKKKKNFFSPLLRRLQFENESSKFIIIIIIRYDKPQDELYSSSPSPPLFIGDAILKSGRVLFEVKAGYSIISARMYRDGGGERQERGKEEEEEEGTVCAYARS